MNEQSTDLHNIHQLMDKVAAHQRLAPSDGIQGAASLAERTLSVYRDQGVEVNEGLVRQLAQSASPSPLDHRLPAVDFLPLEKWVRRLFIGSLAFSSAMFLLLMGCSFLDSSSIAIAPMVGTFLGLGVALVSLFMAPTPLKMIQRQVRVLEPVLQSASWPQLADVLEHPDIDHEVSRQVRLEMVRRRRLGVGGEPVAPATRLVRG